MRTTCMVLLAVLLTGTTRVVPAADNISEALQKGLLEEEANHNLDAAIQAYQSVINQFDDQRRIAATAVFRLGECYRKQGRTDEAVAQYERVLQDFNDQPALSGPSERALAALRPGNPSDRSAGQADPSSASTGEAQEIARIREMIRNSPDLVNAKDRYGSGPLHQAARLGQPRVAEFLLANGAVVDMKDNQGKTPLHLAVFHGNKALVELLLSHGADVNARESGRVTPLHIAVERSFRIIADVLLAKGADINAVCANQSLNFVDPASTDRKSTRLNSSHEWIS